MKKSQSQAELRFYQELNAFLPKSQRQQSFSVLFFLHPTVKDIIESAGVPHTEVDLIIVNGTSVDFSYPLRDGDRVAIYPPFESLDISPLNHLRAAPLRDVKFIADIHLRKLAKYLRLFGFDTLCDKHFSDVEIIEKALREKRIILTRDVGILKNARVTHGTFIHNIHPKEQVVEVIQRLDLKGKIHPFSRCLECNGLLKRVAKEEVEERLPPETKAIFQKFYRCEQCDQLYWEGSHFDKMTTFVKRVLSMVS